MVCQTRITHFLDPSQTEPQMEIWGKEFVLYPTFCSRVAIPLGLPIISFQFPFGHVFLSFLCGVFVSPFWSCLYSRKSVISRVSNLKPLTSYCLFLSVSASFSSQLVWMGFEVSIRFPSTSCFGSSVSLVPTFPVPTPAKMLPSSLITYK